MSEQQILKELVKSSKRQEKSPRQETTDDYKNLEVPIDRKVFFDADKFVHESLPKINKSKSDSDAEDDNEPRENEVTTKSDNSSSDRESESPTAGSAKQSSGKYSMSEQDFELDMDEGRLRMEQLGTLMSAFFENEQGLNVVDAIVQNSKVQHRISKMMEKLLEILEKKQF